MSRILSRLLAAVLALIYMLIPLAHAQGLAWVALPQAVRPGKSERLPFVTAAAGQVSLSLQNQQGQTVLAIYESLAAAAGANQITWNGFDQQGAPVAPGQYQLVLRQGEQLAQAPLSIGQPSPRVSFSVSDTSVRPGQPWQVALNLNMAGMLRISLDDGSEAFDLYQGPSIPGELNVQWDGLIDGQPMAEGTYTMVITLTDGEGFSGNAQHFLLNVLTAQEASPQPADASASAAAQQPQATPAAPTAQLHYKMPTLVEAADIKDDKTYWTLPAGQWDEAAIWEAMMQPVTVVVGGKQQETYKLRAQPDDSRASDNILGEISYEAQGVHVLETLPDGWSQVEVFNSSYGPDCTTRRGWGHTDELIKGYVRTENLKTITPRSDYGLLIDKLKQEMYVFKEGKFFSTLSISTGKPTKQQPWNETPSGEFLMVSKTGDFNAGNLVCSMSMRINGGSLLHEVPYILNEATQFKDYSSQEAQLGEKASHGCVRIQRKKNAEGLNMAWLWNNIKLNTKVLIWDDKPGRFYEYPQDSLALYYNPTGGKYYHADQNCPSIRDRYLPLKGTFTYAQLEDSEFAKLKPCPACNPPQRKAVIDERNRENGF